MDAAEYTRTGVTHKVRIGGLDGFITANVDDEQHVVEVFIHGFGTYGSVMQGWTDAFGIMLSLALQSDLSFHALALRIARVRFEPNGETSNPAIPYCYSIPDYVFRWLTYKFGTEQMQAELTRVHNEMKRD